MVVVGLRLGVPYHLLPAAGLRPVASNFAERGAAVDDGSGPRGSRQQRWAASPGVHRRSSPPKMPLTEMGIGTVTVLGGQHRGGPYDEHGGWAAMSRLGRTKRRRPA
jgi:hypothetical protein